MGGKKSSSCKGSHLYDTFFLLLADDGINYVKMSVVTAILMQNCFNLINVCITSLLVALMKGY